MDQCFPNPNLWLSLSNGCIFIELCGVVEVYPYGSIGKTHVCNSLLCSVKQGCVRGPEEGIVEDRQRVGLGKI